MPNNNRPGASRRARDQAQAYGSAFGPTPLMLTYEDGSTEEVLIPPHPNLGMLDDDRQEAYEELLFETESYDREPDVYIPEMTLESGVILPAETRRGALITPYRKDGELVKPPYTRRVVVAALGDDVYAKLRRAGVGAGKVWEIWHEQTVALSARADVDPKSNGSNRGLASVRG